MKPWWNGWWSRGPLQLIGLFKLLKAALLLLVAVGLLGLLHGDLHAAVAHWVRLCRLDPESRWLHSVLTRLFAIPPSALKAIDIGAFLYAGLFAVEGVGLLRARRWAEWLTVVSTAGLLPLELWEISRHLTPPRVLLFTLNFLIVGYLVWRLLAQRRRRQALAARAS